jgi:uncharacterized membrane protein YdjX (TVP38/TMEM64 family)
MRTKLKLCGLVLVVLIFCFGYVAISHSTSEKIILYLETCAGIEGVILLSILYILNNLLILPFGLPLNLLAGFFWGTLIGGCLINILAIAVSGISFLLGRKFEYFFLSKYFLENQKLKKLASLINQHDWQLIALCRLNPIVPFGLSNYLLGTIPGLSFYRYLITTAWSNLLPCLVVAAFGTNLKNISLASHMLHNLFLPIGSVLLLTCLLFLLKQWVKPNNANSR